MTRTTTKILLAFVISLCCPSLYAQSDGSKNSTKKFRVRPNQLSLKAGTAIDWKADYQTALAASKQTGKPIFWYVPSVEGTFMDRKPEIDRYMLSGPFSWPAIIQLVNEQFTPLKMVPQAGEATKYKIEVYKFVEPGFVIISPTEELILTANRLTTLNPKWLFDKIAATVDSGLTWNQLADPQGQLGLTNWLERVDRSPLEVAETELDELISSDAAELRLVAGMVLHRQGRQAEAKTVWQQVSQDFPDHPMGWKAACEGQGIGPFGRGFEVFADVEEAEANDLDADSKGVTSAANPNTFSDSEIWQSSVRYLLSMQDRSGGFFDSDYDFGGTDSLPNVYVAVTSLVGLAFLEAMDQDPCADDRDRLIDAVNRAVVYVSNDAHLNWDDRDEILWGEAYRVRLIAAAKSRGLESATAVGLQNAVDRLQLLQLPSGTWFHEYANAFVTATALIALADAERAGATVDRAKVDLGLERLASQRMANGAYPYATRRPGRGDAGTEKDIAASGGRISVCELARFAWGRIAEQDLAHAVTVSLDQHPNLAVALKYDNHTSTYAYGGFFFWYDMQARSEAIKMLADGPLRDQLADRQRTLVLALPEIDGCFVDSHELGRCYGTAMGLLSF
jgi:hypothetical protein